MKNDKYIAALVTAVLGIACIFYFMAVVYKGDSYRSLGGAIVMVFEMVIMVVTGWILVSMKSTKPIGQGVFIGAAVTLIIGFGVCTAV
jgi:hypothetical protein